MLGFHHPHKIREACSKKDCSEYEAAEALKPVGFRCPEQERGGRENEQMANEKMP